MPRKARQSHIGNPTQKRTAKWMTPFVRFPRSLRPMRKPSKLIFRRSRVHLKQELLNLGSCLAVLFRRVRIPLALDFLMEAMDKWHSQATVPHKVKLAAAAGSSGGAVCASILGVLSNRSFTHVSDLPTGPVNNLFWKVWVEDFNFEALMKDDDITDKKIDEGTGHPKDDTQTVPAVLNTNMINSAVSSVTDYAEGQSPDVTRSWIAQPLPVGITVGNLRGIP